MKMHKPNDRRPRKKWENEKLYLQGGLAIDQQLINFKSQYEDEFSILYFFLCLSAACSGFQSLIRVGSSDLVSRPGRDAGDGRDVWDGQDAIGARLTEEAFDLLPAAFSITNANDLYTLPAWPKKKMLVSCLVNWQYKIPQNRMQIAKATR